ncbi:MAG: 23S rRNA (adenine(2503)-C(2))-methyltransferase RlmN [Treponemataceae bacterium]|nr:MAG: 23S rRNA (adenine(2503)-C(2))-methyltransferase RlmN [Treponemataceae bacterium]
MTADSGSLLGMMPDEIAARFALEPYRARQIFLWIAKGARSFDEMTNIPLALRNNLMKNAVLYTARDVTSVRAKDGTVKLRLVFPGKIVFPGDIPIETVILRDEAGRGTVCLSSQAGCSLRCAFCQTGQLGFTRNLSAPEIVEQFLTARDWDAGTAERGGKISNVVFMGMGEPLLNFDEVKKAVSILTHQDGIALSARRVTLSTAGITGGIYRLADEIPQIKLAVSITACGEELRARLMPGLTVHPLAGLRQAIIYWKGKTGKRCTLEAALFSGVNTSGADMKLLAAFARETEAHVNLIPWNPVHGLPFSRPPKGELVAALAALKAEGINATLRLSRGGSVAGACGQLGKR